MVVLSKAGLQTLLETDGQLFAKKLDGDAPCLGQVGSGSWEDRQGQRVAFMPRHATEQRPGDLVPCRSSGSSRGACKAAATREPWWEAPGRRGSRRGAGGGGAITPGPETSFGIEARTGQRETCEALVMPGQDLCRCPLKI